MSGHVETSRQEDTTASSSIAIIGGGLGGLALSIGLTRLGVPHKIYEATKQFSEIGAGVSVQPNAIRALSLIDPRLGQRFQEIATYDDEGEETSQVNVRLGQEKLGSELKCGDMILRIGKQSPDDAGRASVHRATLLDEMIKFIPEGISEFRKQMVDLKETDDFVEISFSDGTTARAKAVICCDGVKSRARVILVGKDNPATRPVFAQSYAYRTLVPRAEADEIVGRTIAGTGNLWIGEGVELFHYPINLGSTVNVIAVRVDHDMNWDSDQLTAPCTKEVMLDEFKAWGEAPRGLLNKIQNCQRWGLFDTLPVKSFCKGRLCIMGDAAHAMTSHQGAGASMAFEDAYLMAEVLGDPRAQLDIQKAFEAWDAVQRPRTNRVVSSSREMGDVFTLQHAEVGNDMDRLREYVTYRFQWLWGVDLKKAATKAKALLAD